MKIRRASKKVAQALRRARHSLTLDFLRPRPRIIFVFSTRGELWQGMGRDLIQTDAAFRQTVELCDVEIKKRLGWSVLDALAEDTEPPFWIRHEERLGSALVTIQLALLSSLESRGIRPDAVFGLSIGEVGAAYAAGALSLSDAIQVGCSWSSVMEQQLGTGKRLLVHLNAEEAVALTRQVNGVIDLACEFGSERVILAGDEAAIQEASHLLSERQVENKMFWGDFAFHSTCLDSWKQPMSEYLHDLRPRPLCLPVYSSLTGSHITEAAFDALHWWKVIREPVLFQQTAEAILRAEYSVFLEIGPHPVFGKTFKRMAASVGKRITYLPAMKRDADGEATLDRVEQRLRRLGYIATPKPPPTLHT